MNYISQFKNPFSNYGSIVYGETFVGRKEAIRTIQQRIIDAPDPGCLAIVGPPRIGKSSLAYHTLIYPRSLLLEQRLLTFRVNLPDVNNHEQLFRKLVSKTLTALNRANSEDKVLSLSGRAILENSLSWWELQEQVQEFFAEVKYSGWRVVAVIDEFDAARHIFQNNEEAFNSLRELGYNPEWKVCLVTISRRTLSEIATKSRAEISNFPGIFHDEYIGCFSNEELNQLLEKLETLNMELSDDNFNFVWSQTGGHPYLASALAFHLSDMWLNSNQCDFEKSLQEAMTAFLKYYDDLINILKEEKSLEKLLQILLGPTTTATRLDAEKFSRYGLISPNINGYYTAFSSHFEDYLRLIERSFDLWPLWRDVEKKLRKLIAIKMEEKYQTSDWVSKLEKDRQGKLKPIFDKCRKMLEREQKSFGERASTNLLDFTYPDDLYQIMASDWNLFKPLLGRESKEWGEPFKILAKIRTPLAHNREEALGVEDRELASGYCQKILNLIDKNQNL